MGRTLSIPETFKSHGEPPVMSQRSDQTTFTKGYDLAGNAITRQLAHWLRMKTAIIGNFSSGPGLKCLLILWALHYLGGPIFKIRIWLKNQYRLKAWLRGLLARFKGGAGGE